MAYTALYRKFRPKNFGEVVGQEHVTQTLRNQIKSGRIGHAYLLTGGRGTGKTSTAKILARAINCSNPQDGEPCNECEICKASLEGTLTDVIEMDAASNNSVEDIRNIKEKINFLPTRAKYRVYIIDEVHMLSTGAFNALLKTLEEPPEHVKFILATTEPQKLLTTILSRCQRFDFKKISDDDLIKRMRYVCEESKISIAEGALKLVAVLSEGAARDALSILERCISDGETNIDEDKIRELVGIPKFVYVYNIVKAIIEKDLEKALVALQEVLDEGKDLTNFLWEMIKFTKDILMYKVSKKNDIYNVEEIKQITEISSNASKEELINIIYKLSELEAKMKASSQKNIIFETEIIKLCMKEEFSGIEERIEKLEKAFKEGTIEVKAVQKNNSEPVKELNYETNENGYVVQKTQTGVTTKKVVEPKRENKSKVDLSNGTAVTNWNGVLTDLKKQGKVMLYANLVNTEAVEINDMTVSIRFFNGLNDFREKLLKQPENMNALTKEISMMCGKPMHIKFEDASGAKLTQETYSKINEPKFDNNECETSATKETENSEEDIINSLDIDINIVDE